MGQKCKSSLSIRDKSNVVMQFSYLNVVLAFLSVSKGIFIFYDL